MGIDIKAGGRKATKKTGRTAPVSENLYLRLLVKLYRFLARRTDAKANKVILKRLFTSRTNRPPISLKTIAKHLGDSGKTAVIVGSVTDDVRYLDCPGMTICALRFTNTARAKLAKAGGTCLTFDQLALKSPLGENTMLLRGSKSHRESAQHFGAPGACRAEAARRRRVRRRRHDAMPPPPLPLIASPARRRAGPPRAAPLPRTLGRADGVPHRPPSCAPPLLGSHRSPFACSRSPRPFSLRCRAWHGAAVRAGQGPEVRKGPWQACVARLPQLDSLPLLLEAFVAGAPERSRRSSGVGARVRVCEEVNSCLLATLFPGRRRLACGELFHVTRRLVERQYIDLHHRPHHPAPAQPPRRVASARARRVASGSARAGHV